MIPTPECDRLAAVREDSQMIGEFLDWLNSAKGYRLCTLERRPWMDEPETWQPIYIGIERVLAEYFSINLDKVEQEKRLVLEAIRTQHLADDLAKGQ